MPFLPPNQQRQSTEQETKGRIKKFNENVTTFTALTTSCLLVPSVKLSTIGGWDFPVAGPTIWNSLPDNVISAPSLSTFRQRLKTRPRSLTFSLYPPPVDPEVILLLRPL